MNIQDLSYPTSLFDCCAGGGDLCLWASLCPHLMWLQGHQYDNGNVYQSKVMDQTPLEQYPPFSCTRLRNPCIDDPYLCVCCFFCIGAAVGYERHRGPRNGNKYYCSSGQECCWPMLCCEVPVEDCLIGCCCYCCSLVQVAMAREESFRMQTKLEGQLNVKRAV